MILIDALYINNSGGLVLLEYLVEYMEISSMSSHFLIDYRCKDTFVNIDEDRKTILFASQSNRRKFYRQHASKYDKVLCFGNIPPSFKLKATVYTYFHNINLLEIPKEIGFKQRILLNFKKKFIIYLKSNTDRWIVQTQNTKNSLCSRIKEKEERVLVLPFFRSVKYNDSIVRKRNDYIYVSNYVKEKNHENLILAWNALFKLGYCLTLHMTLSNIPNKLNEVINESIKNGVQIINHGFVNKSKLAELYLGSKATVYPSINESLGLGIIEALQYGCDVIGSDLPFIKTLCEPSLTFNPYSVESIVEAVIDFEKKKYIKSQLLIKDELIQILELLNC